MYKFITVMCILRGVKNYMGKYCFFEIMQKKLVFRSKAIFLILRHIAMKLNQTFAKYDNELVSTQPYWGGGQMNEHS